MQFPQKRAAGGKFRAATEMAVLPGAKTHQ